MHWPEDVVCCADRVKMRHSPVLAARHEAVQQKQHQLYKQKGERSQETGGRGQQWPNGLSFNPRLYLLSESHRFLQNTKYLALKLSPAHVPEIG